MHAGKAFDAISEYAPDAVINAAAFTAVDQAEKDLDGAARLNAQAPAEMAAAAKSVGAHFIHISTDYVFDGASGQSYREDDAPHPLNVYGNTKRDGEQAALSANDQSIILRTSWVFSEFGSNFVKTMLRLGQERECLRIVDDQLGGPTPAREIARAAIAIAEKKHRGAPGEGIYHYQGTPIVSWAAFAKEIFAIAGQNTLVEPIPTKDYPTPAERPLRTVLDCARIERDFGIRQPDWRICLSQVIESLKQKDDQS